MTTRAAAVLFDLDGTLIDSAPDLAGAANEMRADRGLAPVPYPDLRRMVGSGARGMVRVAMNAMPDDDGYLALRDEFLERYQSRMTRETVVFDDVNRLLDQLDEAAMPWGIVTNKATRYAEPVVRGVGLLTRAATLVCGDTMPHSKPHPAPLLEAARRMNVDPVRCVYVGDDLRDVQAGRAAGMATVAVRWGYLGEGSAVNDWGADHVVDSVEELARLLIGA